MTGQRVSTKCLTSGSGLLNIHTRDYDDASLEDFGLRRDQLSRLVEYDETFPLNQEAARLLGVTEAVSYKHLWNTGS